MAAAHLDLPVSSVMTKIFFTENSVSAFLLTSPSYLQLKLFVNANSVLTFMYLLAPMSSIFTDVILRKKNIYELFRNSYFFNFETIKPVNYDKVRS